VSTQIHTVLARLSAALPGLLFSAGALGAACPPLTHVGVSDLGYSSFRLEGKPAGAAVDVINEIAQRTGCKFTFDWFPRERMFVQLEAGRIDIVTSGVRLPERDRLGSFSPYVTTRFELVLLRSVPGSFASLADFVDNSDARLNVVRGIHYPAELSNQLERLRVQGRVEWVSDYETVFKKMSLGRADATLAPAMIYQWHARHSGLQERLAMHRIAEAPAQLAGIYMSSRTLTPEARQLFAQTVREIVADGTIMKIYRRYVDEPTLRMLFPDGGRPILSASAAGR
jgi:polar amino acid transport system substrate-binding protein